MARVCHVCGEDGCFVHCVYCGADCELPEPDHADDCPSVTGLYPVRQQDFHLPCGCFTGMRCSDCEADFQVGDHYTHRELDRVNGIPVYEPICLGCAATEAVA